MDVARIGAISPSKIDWRSLTAKEIIKYNQQGVDVPSEYLRWAEEFRASLDSDDDTTYEMASSAPVESTPVTSTTESESADASSSMDSETSSTKESTTPETSETEAQKKRQELANSGVSMRDQANIFTGESNNNSGLVMQSAAMISSVEAQSINEIDTLENYMHELISKIESAQNEIKNAVANLNNDNGDNTSIGKINKLQQQLEQYGTAGQNSISSSESDFNRFDSIINSQSGIILTTEDFGAETLSIGNDLMTSIRKSPIFTVIKDYIAARRAINSGEGALSNAQVTSDTQTQALATNSDNLSTASGYSGQIESRTGVAPVSTPKASDNKDSEKELDGEEKESEKDVKTAQNDGSDTSSKMTTDINEILKRKIRKGEDISPS